MTEQHEKEHDGQMIVAFHDPLRGAFAQALRALMEALPASLARDIAVAEVMDAHIRVEQALARHRILH